MMRSSRFPDSNKLEIGSEPKSSTAPERLVELHDLGVWYWRKSMHRRMTFRRLFRAPGPSSSREKLWPLRHIDLVCHQGDVLGIVGPNGAGKSTLCLVLSGILGADEGEAHIRGKVSALLTLGAGFRRDLSARANVELSATFLGIPRSELPERIREIFAFAELEDFIDEPIYTYSSGMKARLGFAVASSVEPEILILDEVLAVGDRRFRAKSERRLEELMQASKLIVIVSHSIGFLRNMCTRAVWLDRGRIQMKGDTKEVLDAYEGSSSPPAQGSSSGAD